MVSRVCTYINANPKSEIRNSKQYSMTEIKNSKQ